MKAVHRPPSAGVCSLCSQALQARDGLQRGWQESRYVARGSQAGVSTSYPSISSSPRKLSRNAEQSGQTCQGVGAPGSAFMGEKADLQVDSQVGRRRGRGSRKGAFAVAAPERPGLYSDGRGPGRKETVVVDPENGRRTVLSEGQDGTARVKVGRLSDMTKQFKDVRRQMEEDEDLATLMRGLRGQNLNDEQFASADVQMRLIEIGREEVEGLPLEYDPELIAQFWGARPWAVATRVAQLTSIAGGFLSSIAMDIITNRTKENEVKRAIQLRDIVTSLGPAYIKLGQALSIRPDILSPAAMNELQKLCDKVPSYPSEIAMAFIQEELGLPWYEIFEELSPEPIAAASLGQVYKGKLRSNGAAVAVKVQRPYVLETVTIDLFIIRKLGLALRGVPQIATDVVGLVDEWAARFFEELDYQREGRNGTLFAQQMAADLPQVVVPTTYPEYTSRKVLVTSWLEGEKLSQSTADDVGDLVNIGVICYLKQLLDTGFFHADPHPGNLIRTPDGRLAILDFGLMTQITEDQKYGMIEAISHLIHRDYEAIVEDFVLLDFIPPGVDLRPILPVLAKVFDQALEGGGAKNINFQELAADLAQITFDYPFRIPPYFALIIRAIGVLEGIALTGNSDFAIVDEAYPYIAQRLLTDPSPRLRAALRYTVYGKSGVFDVDRFIDIMEAFETFTDQAKTGGGQLSGSGMASLGQLLPPASTARAVADAQGPPGVQTRAALNFMLSKDGEFFREFILDEVVKGIDAVSRERIAGLVAQQGLQAARIPLLLPGAVVPIPLSPPITREDRAVADNVNKVLAFFFAGTPLAESFENSRRNQSALAPLANPAKLLESVQDILPVLPSLATQVLPEIVNRLTSRVIARFIRENLLGGPSR
ncbi:Predicted unusual protein kinase [Klebsormidium nitens]|uniref:Predicted unusual protein kinase n=1 Tax=Klebsormidium nitens TaxID=105231 RepID=A0A1Y1I3D3_KLENI|nr:Predicted unusual protein kinase [Klebsormidium nitens]|eukprot:GAQ84993.1 Predicted unusual protein kinase [Klebsormidium nitens]